MKVDEQERIICEIVTLGKLVVESEMPEGNDILTAIFNVVSDYNTIRDVSYLFLPLFLSANLKSKFPDFKVRFSRRRYEVTDTHLVVLPCKHKVCCQSYFSIIGLWRKDMKNPSLRDENV